MGDREICAVSARLPAILVDPRIIEKDFPLTNAGDHDPVGRMAPIKVPTRDEDDGDKAAGQVAVQILQLQALVEDWNASPRAVARSRAWIRDVTSRWALPRDLVARSGVR